MVDPVAGRHAGAALAGATTTKAVPADASTVTDRTATLLRHVIVRLLCPGPSARPREQGGIRTSSWRHNGGRMGPAAGIPWEALAAPGAEGFPADGSRPQLTEYVRS
ncbi:hypothetical protein Ait01nite_057260 [Actinoplanes italicus]|nr:hypothetical protein Ait01nite_057260 [Actinoplanes italicus]